MTEAGLGELDKSGVAELTFLADMNLRTHRFQRFFSNYSPTNKIMGKIVPMISSGVAGPLGVLHLLVSGKKCR